jgi:hypothetical protein
MAMAPVPAVILTPVPYFPLLRAELRSPSYGR